MTGPGVVVFWSTALLAFEEAPCQPRVLAPMSRVFLLFFGVAALEAFQTRNWLKALFWMAIGVVFLLADNLKSRP